MANFRIVPAGLILLCLICGGPSAAQKFDTRHAVDLLLVLAVDVSDSINEREASLQRLGYANALADPRVIAAIKGGHHGSIAITFLEWAGPKEQRQIIQWTRIDGKESAGAVREILLSAPISGGYWTSMSGALTHAVTLIATAPFRAKRQVIDLSSDGRNNAGAPLSVARQRAIARGITINGLPVLTMQRNFSFPPIPNLDHYFTDCVIGGPGAFSIVVASFEDLARSVRHKLVREIAGARPSRSGIRPAAGDSGRQKYDCRETPQRASMPSQAGKRAGAIPRERKIR